MIEARRESVRQGAHGEGSACAVTRWQIRAMTGSLGRRKWVDADQEAGWKKQRRGEGYATPRQILTLRKISMRTPQTDVADFRDAHPRTKGASVAMRRHKHGVPPLNQLHV